LKFFIPLDKVPTATHQQKKVGITKTGKPYFYEPDNVKEAKALYKEKLTPYAPPEPMEGAISIAIMFRFPTSNKKLIGQPKTTKPDVDNSIKVILDLLTELKYWHDDNQVFAVHASKIWVEKGKGGIQFAIFERGI